MYCAHFFVGGSNWQALVATVGEATAELERTHREFGFDTMKTYSMDRNNNGKKVRRVESVVQQSAVSLYKLERAELCGCTGTMNFHDYPDRMYVVGTRGGISKATI